jgi:hypothetical protein
VDSKPSVVTPPERTTTLGEPILIPGMLHEDPAAAARAVLDAYQYWTGKLTDTSLQLSFALIAANWAAFGSVDGILKNFWSVVSLSLVLFSLGISVAGAKRMGELHCRQAKYSEADPTRWSEEFKKTRGRTDPWPFTKEIERLGRGMREAKTWLPIAAGIAFILALLIPRMSILCF